jgi:hypothetical protein
MAGGSTLRSLLKSEWSRSNVNGIFPQRGRPRQPMACLPLER